MNIKILAAESLGVRGLCCSVELEKRRIVIDPGIALGWQRHGFLPHPFQVLASGPPLYRFSRTSEIQSDRAWKNAIQLAKGVDTLIIDHHLLRSEQGAQWLSECSGFTENRVLSAAAFMGREPVLLEAWRKGLYEWLPVNRDWHREYEQGKSSCDHCRIKGWETVVDRVKISACRWYHCCPIKRFTEQGKLDRYWIENYCLVGNRDCIRFQMEEKGKYHPDNMLPNGEIRASLK